MRDDNGASGAQRLARAARLGREIRRTRGSLTQAELGALVGRPQSTVSGWESGRVAISLELLARVEATLGLVPGELLARSGFLNIDDLIESLAASPAVGS